LEKKESESDGGEPKASRVGSPSEPGPHGNTSVDCGDCNDSIANPVVGLKTLEVGSAGGGGRKGPERSLEPARPHEVRQQNDDEDKAGGEPPRDSDGENQPHELTRLSRTR
jgi:hypothetical protein